MLKLFIVINVDCFFLSHRKEIAINALKNGYDVTIVSKDTGRRNEIESLGLRFVNLPMNRVGINIFEEIKTLVFLRRLYKRETPDIVHHVGLKTILWGTLAAKITKVDGIVNNRKALLELGVISGEENELRGLKKITREQLILLLKETKTNESIIVD